MTSVYSFGCWSSAVVDELQEDDEQLFDQAIAGDALKFLRHSIVMSPAFCEEVPTATWKLDCP